MVVNEQLKMMVDSLLRSLLVEIWSSPWFAVQDVATDVHEQMCVTIRWVTDNNEINKDLIGIEKIDCVSLTMFPCSNHQMKGYLSITWQKWNAHVSRKNSSFDQEKLKGLLPLETGTSIRELCEPLSPGIHGIMKLAVTKFCPWVASVASSNGINISTRSWGNARLYVFNCWQSNSCNVP